MKNLFLFLIIFTCSLPLVAQTKKLDSLEHLLDTYADSDTMKVKLLNKIAFGYHSIDAEKSLEYAVLSDSLSDELNYLSGKGYSYNVMGIYYYYKSQFPLALEYYQKVLDIGEQIGSRYLMNSAINNSGVIYLYQGNYDEALLGFHRKLETDLLIKDTSEICKCYNNIGIVYHYQGNYPRAIEYYHKVLEFSEKRNDIDQLCSAYKNIAIIYKKQEEYEKALEYYHKSYVIEEKLGNKLAMARLDLSFGALYASLDSVSKSLMYYDRALEQSKKIGDKLNMGICYSNMGGAYFRKKDYTTAIDYLRKAMGLLEEVGSQNYLISSRIDLSRCYYELRQYTLARDAALLSYHSALEMGAKLKVKQSSDILAKIYAAMGDYHNAYNYHVAFKNQSDSLFNESNIKKITNLENQYHFEKEKEAIAAQQAEKDILQAAELKRQKLVRNAFILGFTLMILLALLIVRSLVQKRRANQKLAKQKAEIEHQANELKVANDKLLELDQFKQGLSSMIVHDLKNPLNGILNMSETESAINQLLKVKQAGRQMLHMVQNILDVNKYEESAMTVDKSPVFLIEIAQSAISQVSFLAKNKAIHIENNILPNSVVSVSKDIIERVFVNLLTNAIKYTPNNGHIHLAAEVLEGKAGDVVVSVTDSGQGIPQDQLGFVFNKFAQVNAKSSGQVRSTGLGLTFCKMAVEAHGGVIRVKSELDKGACFEFTLQQGGELLSPVSVASIVEPVDSVVLSAEERVYLVPYVLQLKAIEIYKMFDIRKVIRSIEDRQEINVQLWKDEVLCAVGSGNKKKYLELLALV